MYEINLSTLMLIGLDDEHTKVITFDEEIIINCNSRKIIDNSCKFFGSTLNDKVKNTSRLINISSKTPIIIEESRNIIFFPTTSPRLDNCNWLSLKNIVDYKKDKNNSIVYFDNNIKLPIKISYGSLDNQVLRAARLESIMRNNKK